MSRFASFDGTQLAYEVEGDGFPILLLHGFVSDSFINWVRPGLSDRLVRARRKIVMPDARGHGMSAKPHEPEAYADDAMGRDAIALVDHLGIERCDVMGYSMGAGLTLRLLVQHPGRFRAAVLGGIGGAWAGGSSEGAVRANPIADALVAEDKSAITNPIARSFRDFADLTGADKVALAAMQAAPRRQGEVGDIGSIAIPVLVITGDNDPLASDPQTLADAIPRARCVMVPGTHLNVVNNPAFQDAVLGFLAEHAEAS